MNIRLSLSKKTILFFLLISVFVLGGIMGYIIVNQREYMLLNTKEKLILILEKNASEIVDVIEQNFDKSRGVLYSLVNFSSIKDYDERDEFIKKVTEDALKNNPNYLAFFVLLEMQTIDTNYKNQNIRKSYLTYYNQNGKIKYKTELKDIDKMNENSIYMSIRKHQKDILVEPYWYSYTNSDEDRVLETSIVVPIIKDNVFYGMIGSDLNLDFFKNRFEQVNKKEGIYMFLVSNGGTIISFPDDKHVFKDVAKVFADLNLEHKIKQKIKAGKEIDFQGIDPIMQKEGYYWLKPIQFGKINHPWSVGIFVTKDVVQKEVSKTFFMSLLLIIASIVLIVIFIGAIMQRQVSKPLIETTNILEKIARGDLKIEKINVKRNDEIGQMSKSVNSVIDNLNKTIKFADNVGNGKLNEEYKILGDSDVLGTSLIDMRQSLVDANSEEEKRKQEETKRNWLTKGDALIGEVLRKYNNNMEELSFNVLSNLIDYINALQGSMYVLNTNKENEKYLECTCSIAFDGEVEQKKILKIGEGLVGECAFEQITTYMETIPDNYKNITSGLGKTKPKSVLLVPIILNNDIFGVLEIISLNKIKKIEIEFVESVTEGIASTIFNVRNTEQTQKLLEKYKSQEEELATQEEEIRQNLEELQATQEEVQRLRKEEDKKRQKIEDTTLLIRKIIDNMPYKIVLKDCEGKIMIANQEVANVFNISSEKLMEIPDDELQNNLEIEKIIDAEDYLIVENNEIETTITNDKEISIETKKIPLHIECINTKGILYIQRDVSKYKNKEEEIEKLKIEIEKLK